MAAPLLPLVILPAGTIPLAVYALRPRAQVVAPRRLALARAAIVLGGYAVASVEVLSQFDRLTTAGLVGAWLLALMVAASAAWWRRRSDAPGGGEPQVPLVERWFALGRAGQVAMVAVVGLALAELLLAVVSPPNTYDSQTYHLPRVEHWVAQHNVGFFPVRIHRQVTFAPGAEYLLAHLRLLTGTDLLYGLLQWSAGVLALLMVTRLTSQLGGGRRAQVLAAFVLASAPAVVLESSSTQTDLVVAAWVACLATLVLDGVGRPGVAPPARIGPGAVVLMGVATGLIAVTKQTGLFAAAPLLIWWGLARIRGGLRVGRPARAVAGVAASVVVILGLTAALTGPYVWRVYTEFGHPLGPDYLRNSITMQRHDPASIVVNGARQAQSLFDTPVPYVSDWTAAGVEALARSLGVDPSDPKITFDNATFPTEAWYPSEDKAAYPIQALLIILGVVVCLARPVRGAARGTAGRHRAYAGVVLVGLALHTSMVKWQPWGNRLLLYLVVLAAPLAGLMLAAVFARASARAPVSPAAGDVAPATAGARPRRQRVVAGAMAAALVVGGAAGALSVLYGWPRRLVGADSALVLDDWRARFVMRPTWAGQYAEVGAVVRASGAQRIGIVQQNDTWEYPWWLLFRGRELVAMQSMLPHHPPQSDRQPDAIVCAGSEQACREWVPGGWQVRMYGEVGWALPPERVPPEGR